MRDDFSKDTLDILAKRVGVRCSNPACHKPTTGPRTYPGKIVNIGVGAHITAATEGGPRYDPALTRTQRTSAENGIWLCQNCAKLVDNDPSRYSTDVLRTWKSEAEADALREVEGHRGKQAPRPEDTAELDISYQKEEDKTGSDRHDYTLKVTVHNLGTEPLRNFHIDLEFPRRVIEKPEVHSSFIPGRTTRESCLFRVAFTGEKQTLYPGDKQVAIQLPYFVDESIFTKRAKLFGIPVRATLYRKGLPPLSIHKAFEEIQCF